MPRDFMLPYRVGRTGNPDLDDALARIEDMRQNLNQAACALEDGGRTELTEAVAHVDAELVGLASVILA